MLIAKDQTLKTSNLLARIFVFTCIYLALSATSFAADISLNPSTASVSVGKNFSVDVKVSNNLDNINAVSGVLVFPTNLVDVVSVSSSGSVINNWAEAPKYSNSDGTVSFEGVILNPGFSGTVGKVITVTFKTKASGSVNLFMKSGQVLANDGNATNVLGTLGKTFIETQEVEVKAPVASPQTSSTAKVTPVITSASYPDSNAWYNSQKANFSWQVPSNVIAVRTVYDNDQDGQPNKVYDPPISTKSFDVDGEGVMFMHVQFKTDAGWGNIATYKFQIDTKTPYNLDVNFPQGALTYNKTPALVIKAADDGSGLDRVGISIDGDKEIFYSISSTNEYVLPAQKSGKHDVRITVYDKAGNQKTTTTEYTVEALDAPTIISYTKHLIADEKFTLSGLTYPALGVEVTLTNTDDTVYSEKTFSDEKGQFEVTWPKNLPTGIYDVRARVINAQGFTSDYTEAKLLTVESIPLVHFGIFVMNWLSVILIAIVTGVLIAAVLWYSLIQFGRFRRKVKRRLAEVENTLKVNVQALRRDTEEFHTILVKAEKKRELTKEEQTILRKFKKRLETTEKEIEEKLEQIG